MQARLGSIGFINSLPVDYGLLSGEVPSPCRVVRGDPEELNRLMAAGRLDLGPVSALHYAEHAGELLLLGDLSISSRSGVKSVLFFSDEPPAALGGRRVALTRKGRTTPTLLRLLFERRWGVRPEYVDADAGLESFRDLGFAGTLLIGDEALCAPTAGLCVTDLAEEWRSWTGLPFVFALWVVRRDFATSHPELLEEAHAAIRRSRLWSAAHADRILAAAREATGLDAPALEAYFRGLRYDFDSELAAGLRRYCELAAEGGHLASAPAFGTVERAHARLV
jgi:chorismate dehydratase